jgi:hypothetical protein
MCGRKEIPMSLSESEKKPRSQKKPISEKQLAANRANAAKSTGPKSPEGRANSSQNTCKHGLSSANFTVIRLEDTEEIARLRADLISVYQPVNSQELFALEQMAIRQQAMLRAARFEAGMFSACLNECLESDGSARFPLHEDVTYGIEVTLAQNRNYMLADGFFRLARQGNGIQLFLRYQAQAERLYRRAVEEFERLRKLRPELGGPGARRSVPDSACQPGPPAPNEPISADDPGRASGFSGAGDRRSVPDVVPGPAPNEPISSPPVRPSGAGASAPPPPFRAAPQPDTPVGNQSGSLKARYSPE